MSRRGDTPTPTPLPVDGDIQIFADPDCLNYPTKGEAYTQLWARINVPWSFNDGWGYPEEINCTGPSIEDPDDPYYVLYIDGFISDEFQEPFTAGDVIALDAGEAVEIPGDAQFIFSKPS